MNNFVKTMLGFCFALCLANVVSAATYTVTKIADTNDGVCDADCSLREAIAAANLTADNDTIGFSAAVFGAAAQTIVLSGTDLIIGNAGTLLINGTGTSPLTVSGNNASRVFTNNTGNGTEIRNLRVTGGTGVSTVGTGRGGGVYNNAGVLTLTNVVVTGNAAANGGGLNNAGTATLNVVNCTISNNAATGSGGGLQNFGGNTTNIIGSTISGNTSNSTTVGGGGMQANGTVNIANSTFSGNTATGGGGGIFYNGTVLTMNNVTIANNTSTNAAGGFQKATTNPANLRNNIIAGNTGGGTSPDIINAVNSFGNNLVGAVGESNGWIASDVLNQAAQLAPLNNNGGVTQTHALLVNSPAINAGENCVTNSTCAASNPPQSLTTDQRGIGFPRQLGRVDIGAFEYDVPILVIPKTEFDFDGDRRTDYGVFRPSNGTWYLNRSTVGQSAVQFGLASDRLAPADYDGDGKTDIAVWRAGNLAYFYILQSSNNTFRAEQFGRTGDNPAVVGNWDGDNKADLAVYRNAAGAGGQSIFYYRPSSQTGVDFVQILWGTFGDEALRGDYDGDGKLDAAVYRASDNVWYIRQSSNNQPRYERWGIAADKRLTGDFDGDGKSDLAIFRDGLWAIRQSSNNGQIYRQFGQTGDRPVAGDYDGDGKSDPTIWRGGTFFVARSGNSQLETVQFGANDDAPVAAAFIP